MSGSNPTDETPPVDNPSINAGAAKSEPGSTDNSKTPETNLDKLLEKIQSLESKYEKSEAEKLELRREIGSLGDKLGDARAQVQSNYNIDDIAEKFQTTLHNTDDPKGAFMAVISLVNEAFMERDRAERESIQTYEKVKNRNPEYAKIPYNELRNKAMLDNVWHDVQTGNAMDRYMSNLLTSHNTPENIKKQIADAEKRGAEAERKKLEAAGMSFKSGGGNVPSPNGQQLTTADRIAMNMGLRKPQ